jgi:hypothetical protein
MERTIIALSLLAAFAAADELHRKDGTVLAGKVTLDGDRYSVVDRNRKYVVPAAEVVKVVPKRSFMDDYEERLEALPEGDPEAIYEFGRWLEENDWKGKARLAYEEVVSLDPDHRGARRALGYELWEGEWVSPDELNRKKGLVEFEGQWYTPHALAELQAEMKQDADLRKRVDDRRQMNQQLNGIVKRFASFDKRERRKAHEDVVKLADRLDSPELRKFADDTLAYYDETIRQICAQMKARAEVNVVLTKLKKPIDTFETALGAASIGIVSSQNPVRIQLPEVSIAELHTTVDIPAGCE